MKVGVFATFMSPHGSPEMIADFAPRAENAGLHSLWVGEHVVLFDEMEFPYPGSRDGKIPVPRGGGFLDSVATFGYLAACTKTLRLGTGITLIPQRNPVYTAKEFATLDWLTKGRIDFGVGVGWCKEEVIACGYTWEDRGERCDEFLSVMQQLWTEPVVNFQGDHFAIANAKMDPKPIQDPHIPIIVGGHSKRAFRRAAEFGTGWYGVALNPALTEKMLTQLDTALQAVGRNRDGFEIVITPNSTDADTIKAFADLGVDQLVPQLGSQRAANVDERLRELDGWVAAAG